MLDFQFHAPTQFLFGRNAETHVGTLVQQHGAQRVLLVIGGGSVVRSGLLARVIAALDAAGVAHDLLDHVQPNPTDVKVREGIQRVRGEGHDFLLAVGGGSVIGTAKAIAIGVPYEGDFWDIFTGHHTPQSALPVGVVLTIPAAGSEGSGNSVITNTQAGNAKLSLRLPNLLRPVFSLLNPELTFTLLAEQTSAGVADMMAHVLERYCSLTPDVSLTDRLCEGTLRSIIETAPRLVLHPDDYEARANLMWAGTIAHNGICGVGREEEWVSHFIEHELSAHYGITHGTGLAIVFPAWMRFVAGRTRQGGEPLRRLAQFAIRVMGVACEDEEAAIYADPERAYATTIEGIERLTTFFHSLGLPTTLTELIPTPIDIPLLVEHLHRNKGARIGHFCPLDATDTARIYALAIDPHAPLQ